MRRPIATLLIAAAACIALPAAADAAGHGRNGGNHGRSVSAVARVHAGHPAYHRPVVARVHAGRPVHHRPAVVRWHRGRFGRPVWPYRYRPSIFFAPRPVSYAPPPVVYVPPAPVVYTPPAAQPVQAAAAPERFCREYQTTITVGGHTEQAYGTACREPDGSWEKVE